MELHVSHIELKHSDTERIGAPTYANTIISTERVAHTTTPKSGDSGQNEGLYEKLRLGTKQNEAKRTQNASRSLHWEDIPNRIKYAVYTIIAVIVVLFVAVIVLIVLIALPKNTVDGNWTQWSPWSNCDVTCNNGTQTRMRFCINPASSNGGIDCSGISVDTKQCKNDGCSDGDWSSCDGGVRTRLRTCTNPRPSMLGRYCDGSPVVSCNKQACPSKYHKVAFTVYGTNSTNETSNVAIKFPYTILNIGGGYNISTGRFTSKIPGIYNFAVTLTKKRQNIDYISAYLRVNGYNKLRLYSDPDDTHDVDYGSYSLSVAGNFHLNKNDYVYVSGVPSHFYDNDGTSFTGVLVIPDE